MTRRDRISRALARLYLPLGLLCGALVLHAVHLACVAEDGHITFRFARHLAEGHGFVWNVGERPIEGFTSLLWVLIAAAGIRAGLDVFWLTQALGTLSALGILVLTFEFARRRMQASNAIALAPSLLLACSGPLATWASSGMETTTFAFFVLLGVFGYVTHLQRPSQRWLLASGLSLYIATLLRPEGVFVFVVLAAMAIVFRARTRISLRQHVLWALAYAVPFVLFMAWRFHEFSDWVPNTFHQKTGGGFWQHARGAGYLIYFAFYYLLPLAPIPALLLWEVGIPDYRRLTRPASWLALANEHEAAATCGVLSLAYFALMVYEGGDYMAMYRFMVPILPFLYLLLVPMLERLGQSTLGISHKAGLTALTVALAALATAFHSTPFERSFFRVATWQHGNYRGVLSERRYVARFSLIGRFFERYKKSNFESLATRSIGAIGYYAQSLAIHDLSGLTDRHIAHVQAKATNRGWAGHEKWDLDYSFNRLPTYFMLDENLAAEDIARWSPSSAEQMADAIQEKYPTAERFANWMRANPEFIEKNYRLVTVWMDDHVNGEKGYFAFLERKSSARESTSETDQLTSTLARDRLGLCAIRTRWAPASSSESASTRLSLASLE